MIELKIKKNYGDFQLAVNLKSQSKRIGILGASGCGKSMTLKSIAGIETPAEGWIQVDGRTLYDSSKKLNIKPQKRNIGYLFQNYALFPTMTVEENIAAGLKCSKKSKVEIVHRMMEKFQILGLEKHLPGQLSGGQQQRVALARIMAYEPSVILLDEPFSALDSFLKDRLQQDLLEMLEDYEGIVIMVSHNRDEIYRFSDEIAIMEDGHMLEIGPAKEIFERPKHMSTAKLTGCKNYSAFERIDAHHGVVLDWGIELVTDRVIPEGTTHIGYRAHDFVPCWHADMVNSFSFEVASMSELPFERNYYICPVRDSNHGQEAKANGMIKTIEGPQISWFVQKHMIRELEEKGMPRYLALDEDNILFLKE